MGQYIQHIPTEQTRSSVRTLCFYGAPTSEIAATIGISEEMLHKHYEQDILKGRCKASIEVGKAILNKIKQPNCPPSLLMFCAKNRMGWNGNNVGNVMNNIENDGENVHTYNDVGAANDDQVSPAITSVAESGNDSTYQQPAHESEIGNIIPNQEENAMSYEPINPAITAIADSTATDKSCNEITNHQPSNVPDPNNTKTNQGEKTMRITNVCPDSITVAESADGDAANSNFPYQYVEVCIADISIGQRMRDVNLGKVHEIAASIVDVGLLQPIVVRSDMLLISGLQRLEAYKLLGYGKIPAVIQPYTTSIKQKLSEIDENLIRNDLTELQRAIYYAEREQLYLQRHPDKKNGGDRRSQQAIENQNANIAIRSFPESLSRLTGESIRTVATKKSIGKRLADFSSDLVGTAIEDNQSELLALSRLRESNSEFAEKVVSILVANKNSDGEKFRSVTRIVEHIKKQERIADVERQAEAIRNSPPSGPFHVIVMDPPWEESNLPYPTMSLDEISAIELPAADDCILWLWTTQAFLRHSFGLVENWGFRYIATLTWAKKNGRATPWLHYDSEFCILAVRGNPPANLMDKSTIIHGAQREHSRKPEEFYEMVESSCFGIKLDYFARVRRNGWEQVGNELDKFDEAA